ncbi:MAG: 30S ribosomal protein S2 [bacterium]|nr:30S ribosomal protein S2 [bacterium]
MTDTNKLVEELFAAGAHLGHKTNRVYPKAKKYIYTIDNGVSIIDLVKTVEGLEKGLTFISNLATNNKVLLIVVTKRVSSAMAQELCKTNNIAYVTMKWPAGLLTNFDKIIKNAKKLKQMKEEKEKGEWNKFVKHEQVKMTKDMNRLERLYGGLVSLTKLPDALFVIDIKKEKNAVNEGSYMHVPVVAITDTNVNPDLVTYAIPANDDSLTSIEYLLKKIVEAYASNKSKVN